MSLTQERALSFTTTECFCLVPVKIEFNPKLMSFRLAYFLCQNHERGKQGKERKNEYFVRISSFILNHRRFVCFRYKMFIQFYRISRILLVLIFISMYNHHTPVGCVRLGAISYFPLVPASFALKTTIISSILLTFPLAQFMNA